MRPISPPGFRAAAEPDSILITADRAAAGQQGFSRSRNKGARRPKGVAGAGSALSRRAGERRRPAGWGARADAAGRPRGRTCAAGAPRFAGALEGEGESVRSSASLVSASRA